MFIETGVSILTGVYLGRRRLGHEIEKGRIFLSGEARPARTIGHRLKLSMYADTEGIAVADG